MMYDLFLGIPYDLLPLLLIIILHRRNLYAEKKWNKQGWGRQYGTTDSEIGEERSLMNSVTTSSVSTNHLASSTNPQIMLERISTELKNEIQATMTLTADDTAVGKSSSQLEDKESSMRQLAMTSVRNSSQLDESNIK